MLYIAAKKSQWWQAEITALSLTLGECGADERER